MTRARDSIDTGPPTRGSGLTVDAFWNLGALALMATTGAAVSLFILAARGANALGVFSQVYAIYVVAAQLATLGIHDSAQRHAAKHSDDATVVRALCRGAFVSAALSATLVAGALAGASPLIGRVTQSDAVGTGVLVVAPGLLLFGINKALLGVLNGLRRMRAYALAQSARALTILGAIVVMGLSPLPDSALVAGFVAAEAVVFCGAVAALWRSLWGEALETTAGWLVRHVRFGLRALPNGLLAESFVRIDVLMLGLFVTDAEVGTYGFAAFFAEGLVQIAVVVRTVVNPVLAKLLVQRDRRAVARICRRAGAASVGLTALGAVAVLLCLPLLGPWLGAELVASARSLLGVLALGICFYAAFLPSDYLLLQAGLPGRQSALMVGNVAVSVLLNALLIRHFGPWGAAWATSLAYGWSALALMVAVAVWLGMTRTPFVAPSPLPPGPRPGRIPDEGANDVG